ncbi:hypothetical protein B9T19_03060 [Ignatzschineria sp. F8392]|nr:hypothetical protein B9T19_03060 [Ignatzschineria sp. F8392]
MSSPAPIAEKTESGNKMGRVVVLLFVARAHKSRKVVNRGYILFSLKRMSIWQKRDFFECRSASKALTQTREFK